MALTASEISQVYEMLGIPQGGSAMAIDNLATMFGPFAQAYDFTAIITLIDAKLAALSATNIVRVQTLLTFPQIGYLYQTKNSHEIRILLYGHYRIAYLLKNDSIYILGVYHGALEMKKYFNAN